MIVYFLAKNSKRCTLYIIVPTDRLLVDQCRLSFCNWPPGSF